MDTRSPREVTSQECVVGLLDGIEVRDEEENVEWNPLCANLAAAHKWVDSFGEILKLSQNTGIIVPDSTVVFRALTESTGGPFFVLPLHQPDPLHHISYSLPKGRQRTNDSSGVSGCSAPPLSPMSTDVSADPVIEMRLLRKEMRAARAEMQEVRLPPGCLQVKCHIKPYISCWRLK
ncbi:hypothetical protein EVAR_57154_1 [Eumeta japonica]|uniref:Uncharacterized protein n=1 Tax=Eumeta variegata TaxID=151549 RepID=A0A4C1YQQ1_EUMVA|nr:hypothetical protein EVAR_57154_1 [Eumeta japonica]